MLKEMPVLADLPMFVWGDGAWQEVLRDTLSCSTDHVSNFKVVVKRRCQDKMGVGLHMDITEGAQVHISEVINNGPVWSYNATVREDLQVRPGDFLTAVNGLTGSSSSLVRSLQADAAEVTLEISRPKLWEVRLQRRAQEGFGLSLTMGMGTQSLVVSAVEPGAAETFNSRSPEAAIRPGDRILAIAGASADISSEEKLAMLQRSNDVRLSMSRPRLEFLEEP